MPKRQLDLSPGSLLTTAVVTFFGAIFALAILAWIANHFDDVVLATLLFGPVVAVLALVLRK